MIATLRESLLQMVRSNVPVQVVYAQCTAVDAEGSMTAEREGIEYHDVLLGLGKSRVRPRVGSQVLLGLVENRREAAFLIYAEEIEDQDINGSEFGGLVRADEVAQEVNQVKQAINQLKQLLATWIPVPNDGGAALKSIASSWAGQPLEPTVSNTLQNPQVRHGGA